MNNRVAYLISKRLSAEMTENEVQELNEWLAADPALYEIIGLLEIAWKNQPPPVEQAEQDENSVRRLMKKLRFDEPAAGNSAAADTAITPKPRRISLSRWAVAAAVLGLIALSVWKITQPVSQNRNLATLRAATEKNLVSTRPGNRTRIDLPDGSRVWLNADSKLSYQDFGDHESREVYLEGEAFFDVVSNPARPFIIHTEKTRVKVTGTTLNVRDYPGEFKAETSLLTGKAEVYETVAPEKVYYLRPNEKVVFKEKRKPIDILPANESTAPASKPDLRESEVIQLKVNAIDNLLVETAWVNDQLAFSDESFREVADKMEKWYGVKIVFAHEDLENMRFTGKFKNESLNEALMALQFTAPFQFEAKSKTIIITKK